MLGNGAPAFFSGWAAGYGLSATVAPCQDAETTVHLIRVLCPVRVQRNLTAMTV